LKEQGGGEYIFAQNNVKNNAKKKHKIYDQQYNAPIIPQLTSKRVY
jgi:hypothetical protein